MGVWRREAQELGFGAGDHYRHEDVAQKTTKLFNPTGNPRGIWGVWRGHHCRICSVLMPRPGLEGAGMAISTQELLCSMPGAALSSNTQSRISLLLKCSRHRNLVATENWDGPAWRGEALGGPHCDLPGPVGTGRTMERGFG